MRDPPFVATRTKLIPFVIDALKLQQGSFFYELGCGDGRILAAAIRNTNGANGIGIDNNLIAYLIAKFRTRRLKIDVIYDDIMQANIGNATHIYAYLLPIALSELEIKIIAECKKGTLLVSYDFEFPNLKPIKIIALPESILGTHKLFVYKVNK